MQIPGIKTPLWEHQERMVRFGLEKHNVMWAAEMGTGKSLATLALMVLRHHQRILIACPLSVVGSWENQLREHADFPYVLARLDKGVGSVQQKQERAQGCLQVAAARQCPAIVVVNHESLWRVPFGNWALAAGFDFVVCDESHRGKSNSGKLGKYLMQLGWTVPYRLALTGTPFAHSPLSIFSQFRFVENRIFGKRYQPFKNRYAVLGGFQGRQVIAYQNLEELQAKFHQRALVITKKEALPDLPEQIFVERVAPLDAPAARIYHALAQTFYAELEAGEVTASNALVKLLRLQQLTSGHLTLDDGSLQWVSDHKKALLADTLEDVSLPVVVFARFTRDLDVIQGVAESLGLAYGEVSGRRKDLTDASKMQPETDILSINISAGGVGIDLTRASTSIWYSLNFNFAEYEQALARLHRPGQKRKVAHIFLIVPGTVDEQIRKAFAQKKDLVDWILKKESVT